MNYNTSIVGGSGPQQKKITENLHLLIHMIYHLIKSLAWMTASILGVYLMCCSSSSCCPVSSKEASAIELTLDMAGDPNVHRNPLQDYVSAEDNPNLPPYNKKLRPNYGGN